ncbi:TetR/AcrR family transcriptional regulator [Actinomadura rupiterrae]|uniref:TetR/AcrR family transcriptional regulator n=1 Tax=Actinomadura rupiterrae TaxID=559627 RepID=UPI0020A2ABAB|nr:TetR/AcrR family transcriptional regulator [Actinomadura rupiterrae]MCP2342782.1 AcrR family transcriptional regulator [Actinomadura rupiterrae]
MSTRAPGRPYHHGSLREALVAHAVGLLDEAGPDAVVVREAARRAGVAPSAPFRHFPGRAALLTAVTEAVAVDFCDELTRAVDAADDVPFRALGNAFVRYALAHPHRFALLRGAVFGADRTPALEEGHRAVTQRITELIMAGQERGELRKADPELTRITAQALVFGLSQMFVDGYLDTGRAEALTGQVLDLFGLGVLAPDSDLRSNDAPG